MTCESMPARPCRSVPTLQIHACHPCKTLRRGALPNLPCQFSGGGKATAKGVSASHYLEQAIAQPGAVFAIGSAFADADL